MKNAILFLLLLPLAAISQPNAESFFIRPEYSAAKSLWIWKDVAYQRMGGFKEANVSGYLLTGGYRLGPVEFGTGVGHQRFSGLTSAVSFTPRIPLGVTQFTTQASLDYVYVPITVGYSVKWFYCRGMIAKGWQTNVSDKLIYQIDPNDDNASLYIPVDAIEEMERMRTEGLKSETNDDLFFAGLAIGVNIPIGNKFAVSLGGDGKVTLSRVYKYDPTYVHDTFLTYGGSLSVTYYFNLKK